MVRNVTEQLQKDLEYYSALEYHDPRIKARLVKATRYMEAFEKFNAISSRKLATIVNVIREAATERMVEYNADPKSEAYWSS